MKGGKERRVGKRDKGRGCGEAGTARIICTGAAERIAGVAGKMPVRGKVGNERR